MEFKFGSCKATLNKYIVAILLCSIILITVENIKIIIFVSTLLFFTIIINIFEKNNYPVSVIFNEKNIILKFCRHFGYIERIEIFDFSNLYFTKKTDPYSKGVRDIVKVYDKGSNKVLFKIADNIHNKNDLEKIVELMLEQGIAPSHPNFQQGCTGKQHT